MSFAPSQQPGGNSYYDYQSCALPSPAVDYSATDAPDVDVSLWIWDAADPDFLTCATTGVSFPNGDFEENTTTLGPTLLKNWAVFLPATFVNLAFLPNELRLGS